MYILYYIVHIIQTFIYTVLQEFLLLLTPPGVRVILHWFTSSLAILWGWQPNVTRLCVFFFYLHQQSWNSLIACKFLHAACTLYCKRTLQKVWPCPALPHISFMYPQLYLSRSCDKALIRQRMEASRGECSSRVSWLAFMSGTEDLR